MNKKIYLTNYILCIILLVFFYGVYYDTLYIEIHDNLDQHYGWYQLLNNNNAWFADNKTQLPFMNGIDRGLLLPETQLVNMIYMIFKPINAHIVLFFTKFSIAYASFILLVQFLFEDINKFQKTVFSLIAISFALLPGNENLLIAQASIPLILFLYLNYLKSSKHILLLLIFLYPILSELARFGMFILFYMSIHALFLLLHKDSRFFKSLTVIVILSIGYLCVEYRLILSSVFSSEDTIRKFMVIKLNNNFPSMLYHSFFYGNYHFPSPIIFLLFFSGLLFIWNFITRKKHCYIVISLVILIFINSLIYTTYLTSNFHNYLWHYIPVLHGWNYSRCIWFNFFICSLMFCYLILSMPNHKKIKFIIIFATIFNVGFTITKPFYGSVIRDTIKCNHLEQCNNKLNFNEFYSVKLFNNIKYKITYKKTDRAVAFGFHPSILTYNDIFTVDGYHNAYYQKYKNQFRTLIQPSLDVSKKYQKYFDNWGGRAYIFSEDVEYGPYRQTLNLKSAELLINYKVASEMNIKYVFSRVKLKKNRHLRFIRKFTHTDSPYTIFLYSIS